MDTDDITYFSTQYNTVGGPPAREARQRSTMGNKIWYTIRPRKFGYDVAYARTLFAG